MSVPKTDQTRSWSAITINAGQLSITNSSTSVANRFLMGSNLTGGARNITPLGLGSINIAGNRISLGTGTGGNFSTLTWQRNDAYQLSMIGGVIK